MIVLALDPSTKFGWALHRMMPDPAISGSLVAKIDFGTWKLQTDAERKAKARVRPGAYFARALKQVTELRKRFGIDDQPLQFVIEDTALNAIGSADTKHLAESWRGQIETYAEVRGFPEPVAVGVNSWRSAFIGRSMAPKEVSGEEERRKWIKDATLAECKRRGLAATDDNQADALGILFWFLVGGQHVQEQRRADKKAKTKAKRAQLRLFTKAAA